MKKFFTVSLMTRQALIAALYALLTFSGFGIGYGPVQFRYSEILNWLCFLDPKNIVGLTLGCFIANITSPYGLMDMVVGTLGTLLATYCMAKSRSKYVAMFFPSVFSFLYSAEAVLLGQIPKSLFFLDYGKIALSEIIITGLIGIPFMMLALRFPRVRNLIVDPSQDPTKESLAGRPPFPF